MDNKRRGPYGKRESESNYFERETKFSRTELEISESDLVAVQTATSEISENDLSNADLEITVEDLMNDENILNYVDNDQVDLVALPSTSGAYLDVSDLKCSQLYSSADFQPTRCNFDGSQKKVLNQLADNSDDDDDDDDIDLGAKNLEGHDAGKNALQHDSNTQTPDNSEIQTEVDIETDSQDISDIHDFVFHHLDSNDEFFEDANVESDADSISENTGVVDEEIQPLFPGATVTVGAMMLLIALFVTKHSLVGEGIQQLLNIIALTLPQTHKLCTTVHAFKMYFRNLKNPLVKHYYCGHCLGYIKDPCAVFCPYKKCKKSQNKKMEYFLEMPVKSQIQKLLTQEDFYANLQGRFSSRTDDYKDIYDGKVYKSYFDFGGPLSNPDNISFTFNTDGAAVFKSSNVSVWPLFLIINELPYSIRMKKENMILAGLWFGNKKPAMGTFLQPFLEAFKELEIGIEVSSPERKDFTLKAFLLCGTADLPARSLLCNSVQYNGSFSCWKCLQRGETAKVGKGHTHIFPYSNQPKEPFRTKESVLRDSQKSLDMQESGVRNFTLTNGVKGPSWLTLFPRFDIVDGIAIDYMHGVLLGVQKLLINLWFSVSYKGKPFNFCNQVCSVDERLLSIRPNSAISRLPRSISNDLRYWKASEFRSFLLFYGAPVMNGILDKNRFVHYLLLVNSLYILLKSGSTEANVNQAEIMLFEFVKLFSLLYDKCFMTLNVHQLVHLADSVRSLGPLFTHSCFSFEDKNGVLLKMIQGTQNIDNQIITGVSFLQRLPELKQITVEKGSEIEELCNSIENPNILSRGLKLAKNVYVLGAIKTRTLTDAEHSVVCKCLGYDPGFSDYKYFKRMDFNNFLIYGTTYTRMTKRDNSTIAFKSKNNILFAKVLYFIFIDKNDYQHVLAIANELKCKNYAEDSNILLVERLDKPLAIPIECITESCIFVDLKDKTNLCYVCRVPNSLECD